jgi:hypothetical protein
MRLVPLGDFIMPFRARAKANPGHPGFRRGGVYFLSDTETILSDEEMTPAIQSEARLIVNKITASEAKRLLAQGANASDATRAALAGQQEPQAPADPQGEGEGGEGERPDENAS